MQGVDDFDAQVRAVACQMILARFPRILPVPLTGRKSFISACATDRRGRRRQDRQARSLTDDEIVLLRIMILRDAKVGGRRPISSARYFMADADVHPSETTVVTPAMMELNAERQPTSIDVPGVNERVAARTVQLDDFVRCGLAGIVAQHLTRHANADTSPLGYSGTYPAGGHYASASASSGLKKLFARAGLDSNLKPLGLVQWRIEHTLAHKGLDAAVQLSGGGITAGRCCPPRACRRQALIVCFANCAPPPAPPIQRPIRASV